MPDSSKKVPTSATETARERASARLDDARERFEKVAGSLGDKVKSVSETAKKRGSKLGRHGAEIGRRAIASATSAGEQARERYGAKVEHLQEGYVQARDHIESWSDDLGDYVRSHPGRAVLGAVLAGFLVGMLSRRRRS